MPGGHRIKLDTGSTEGEPHQRLTILDPAEQLFGLAGGFPTKSVRQQKDEVVDGWQLGLGNAHKQPMPVIGKLFSRCNHSCEFFET